MSHLRVLFNAAVVAVVVFLIGVRYGARWTTRPPVSLSIASEADGLAYPESVPATTRTPQPDFVDPFADANPVDPPTRRSRK